MASSQAVVTAAALRRAPARGACTAIATAYAAAPPIAAAPVTGPTLRLADLSFDRLSDVIAGLGLPRFRARQVFHAVYARGAREWDAVLGLGAADRALLAASLRLDGGDGRAAAVQRSADGTTKWLVPTSVGAPVEAVLIPSGGAHAPRRRTLCVSSQAGCSLACAFCHTGTQRLAGNLSAGDIVGQVLLARAEARAADVRDGASDAGTLRGVAPDAGRGARSPPPAVHRIVFMGQGEPLLNWRAVRTAVDTLLHPVAGLGLVPRHITISTAGVAPLIARVATETPLGVRLAVSLHAPDDATRGALMDVNARWPLRDVMAGVAEFVRLRTAALAAERGRGAAAVDDDGGSSDDDDDGDSGGASDGDAVASGVAPVALTRRDGSRGRRPPRAAPVPAAERHNGRRRVRVSFEYVLLRGVNDAPAQARAVAALLRAHLPAATVHVNLIEYNPWPGARFAGSARGDVLAFQAELGAAGVRATIRASRGADVLGACGQLRSFDATKASRGLPGGVV